MTKDYEILSEGERLDAEIRAAGFDPSTANFGKYSAEAPFIYTPQYARLILELQRESIEVDGSAEATADHTAPKIKGGFLRFFLTTR